MTTISSSQLETFLGANKFVQLFDDDKDGTADTAVVALILTQTDGTLSTLDLTSAEKTMAAYDIASYYGHYRRNMSSHYVGLYNYWLGFKLFTMTSSPCWNPEEKPVDTGDSWFDEQMDEI